MPDCSPGVSQQMAEVNGLNSKLAYDSAAQLQHQSLADNQEDSRGWAALKLRIAQNAATIDHLANVSALTATGTGDTSNQQTTSPIRTGAGDAIAAVPGVAAGQVSANIADIATIVKAVVSETLQAVIPVIVAASGKAAGTNPAA